MKTTKIETIENELQTILTARDNELQEIEKARTAAEKELQTINPQLEQAAAKHDLATYQQLKKRSRDLEDKLEMFLARRSQIDNLPYITEEQRQKYENDIKENFNAAEAEVLKKFIKLATEMKNDAEELEALLNRSNQQLALVSDTLCNDHNSAWRHISSWNVIALGYAASKHEIYKKMTEGR